MKSLIASMILIPVASFASMKTSVKPPPKAPPSQLITHGQFKNQLVLNQEIKALDDSAVTAQSWNRSEDLRGISLAGAMRFETRETSDRHSDRIFYEVDPKTAQLKILFTLDDSSLIKRWTEDANGIHLYYCSYTDEQQILVQSDVGNGGTNELGQDCANQAIPLPNGDYWSFYRNSEDPKRRSGFVSSLPPLYSNFKPVDVSQLPKAPVFEPEKISISANGKYLALPALAYDTYGTYVYDIQNHSVAQFKFATGAGYSRPTVSGDGQLVSGYIEAKADKFASQFLALYSQSASVPERVFVPTLRQDDAEMFDFSDAQFSLDDSKIAVTVSSHATDPYSNDNRHDVDVFDVKTGAHLLRIQRSWIAKNLDHNRVLIQSWVDRTFSILDLSKPVPTITHSVTYPANVDAFQAMHASFAGNDLVVNLEGKSYIFELGQ